MSGLFPEYDAPPDTVPGDAPLAARMRPRTLEEFIGQEDLIGPGMPLRRAIEQYLEDMLAEEILRGTFHGADTITVKIAEENGEKRLAFDANAPAPAVVGQ